MAHYGPGDRATWNLLPGFRGKSPDDPRWHEAYCGNGHPRTEKNTLWLASGRRRCRACDNAARRRSRRQLTKIAALSPRTITLVKDRPAGGDTFEGEPWPMS